MKTLVLAPEIFTPNGGIPRILRLYLKALCDIAAERDGQVRLVALNDSSPDSTELRRFSNDRLEAWEVCSGHKARFIRTALRHGRKCDHVVCGHVAQLPVALALKLRNHRLTYDVVAHGIEVWRPFSLAERAALRFVRRVLCISDYTRRTMHEYYPVPEERMVLVPNGLDAFFPIAASAAPPPKPPVILTVARLTRADIYKGIDTLIQAMPLVRKEIPDATLRIIGHGDDALRLRHLANDLGLFQEVQMLGFVEDDELQRQLAQCTLFALPSKKEGFGLVFLEAMAQGRPCLGARAGGIPEVITPDTGLLCEYGDVPGIAAACAEGLRRSWDPDTILARVRDFSFERFRGRLYAALNSTPTA